jgi:hypothetical protein
MKLPEKRVIQDVVTRWNSTYDMLVSVLESRKAIVHELSQSEDLLSYLPSLEEWDMAIQLVWVLGPFKQATRELSHERNVSVSLILPLLAKLKSHLTATPQQFTLMTPIGNFRRFILQDINARASSWPSQLFAASFLDPRFKRLDWISRSEVKATLIKSMEEEADKILPPPPPPHSSSSSSIGHVNLWGESTDSNSGRQEVQRYLYESTQAEKSICPLHWWSTHQEIFPRLAILARKYLTSPATSTSSERVFSTAGDILSDTRNRLDSELADQFIFLNANFQREI